MTWISHGRGASGHLYGLEKHVCFKLIYHINHAVMLEIDGVRYYSCEDRTLWPGYASQTIALHQQDQYVNNRPCLSNQSAFPSHSSVYNLNAL